MPSYTLVEKDAILKIGPLQSLSLILLVEHIYMQHRIEEEQYNNQI